MTTSGPAGPDVKPPRGPATIGWDRSHAARPRAQEQIRGLKNRMAKTKVPGCTAPDSTGVRRRRHAWGLRMPEKNTNGTSQLCIACKLRRWYDENGKIVRYEEKSR